MLSEKYQNWFIWERAELLGEKYENWLIWERAEFLGEKYENWLIWERAELLSEKYENCWKLIKFVFLPLKIYILHLLSITNNIFARLYCERILFVNTSVNFTFYNSS